LIASQGVVARNLHEDNRQAVWILDPHFDKPPWLLSRLTDYANTGCEEPLVLSIQVANLDPECQVVPGAIRGPTAQFKEATSQEEDQPRVIGRAELSKDCQSQRVSIEVAAALRITRTHQNSASQNLHGRHHARLRRSRRWPAHDERRRTLIDTQNVFLCRR
jgi:hypothetical protein